MKRRIVLLLISILVLTFTACKNDPKTYTEINTDTDFTDSKTNLDTLNPDEQLSDDTESEENTQDEGESENKVMEATGVPIKDVFAEHNIKAGTCLSPEMIRDEELSLIVKEQFNSVTMENLMKPDAILDKHKSISTGKLSVSFSNELIRLLDYAKDNNMAVRGHTFVWYSQTPDWIFYEDFDESKELVDRDTMLNRMESFISETFDTLTELGYADMFYAYDIVNEAFEDNGMLRSNNWKRIIGDDYIYYAFLYAKSYAPENIALYYNDYNEQYKAEKLAKFVTTLVDEEGNSLIDGIGLQAHLYTYDNLTDYLKAVDTLASTGLTIEITELDISLGSWQVPLEATDENLLMQGRFCYSLLHNLFDKADKGQIKMDALTFWGFADNLSWRKDSSPLLYDKNLNPKYSYYAATMQKELAGCE